MRDPPRTSEPLSEPTVLAPFSDSWYSRARVKLKIRSSNDPRSRANILAGFVSVPSGRGCLDDGRKLR
jgi:hypothetical protein